MKKLLSISLVASSLLLADADLQKLVEQMNKQQKIIEQLQAKITKIEKADALNEEIYTKNINMPTGTAYKGAVSSDTTIAGKTKTFGQSKYIPDISLVADFSAVARSEKDDALAHLEIPGLVHGLLSSSSEEGHSHAPNNAKNGFNFNYAELALSSHVDPYFTLDSVFHITGGEFEVEELYFTSTALGNGIKVKGGKFLSNFGYLNDQHHHVWSFADTPLVYEAFFGSEGLNEIGLQAQWVAPTSNYLMLGLEVLQGNNERTFGTDSIGDAESPHVKGSNAPALFVAYAKTSFDIDNTTILGGVSYANGSSRIDETGEEEPHIFTGNSEVFGVDLLVKHQLDSYSYVSLQTEAMLRKMDGSELTESVADSKNFDVSESLTKEQAGMYTQLEYGIDNNWKSALRYETFFKNEISEAGAFAPDNGKKYSAMVEYRSSEFAKFRLQYNRNEALYNEDGQKQKIDSLILQANFSIGAHGAHSF